MQKTEEFSELPPIRDYDIDEQQQAIARMSDWLVGFYNSLLTRGLTSQQAFTLVRDWQQHLLVVSPEFTLPFVAK